MNSAVIALQRKAFGISPGTNAFTIGPFSTRARRKRSCGSYRGYRLEVTKNESPALKLRTDALKWLTLGVVVTTLVVALVAGLVFFSSPAPEGSTLKVGPTFTYTVINGTYTFSATDGFSNYAWNFGDGSTGTGSIVSHTYDSNGNYTVTLTASPVRSSESLSAVQQVLVSSVTSIVHNYFVNLNVSVGNTAS